MKTSSRSDHRRRICVVLAVALVLAGGLWLGLRGGGDHGGSSGPARDATAVPVSMATAEAQDVDIVLHALGTVTPVNMATITSRVAGVLQEIRYTEGQMVKRNDLLAVIDPRPYEAALAQTQGQRSRDEAVLANARLDLQRYQTAFGEHAIPEQQVATQQAAVDEDEGVVRVDQAAIDAARVNLDYTRITAPFDGRVGLRLLDLGNNVQANGTGGLVTLTQLAPITVSFTLAQDVLPQVMAGMRRGEPMKVVAFYQAGQKPIAEGRLLTIGNEVDAATGTFRLKAAFANADTALWPGEFVNLDFIVGVRKNAVTIAARAVQRGPNGPYLFVVRPDMTVEARTVEVAQSDENVAVISQGLAAGEHVVVDGQYRLEQGTRVAQQKEAGAPAGS